jgi:hypothetical protein
VATHESRELTCSALRKLAVALTPGLAVLAGVASAYGLLDPTLYAGSALGDAMRGQDLLTLLTLPVLLATLPAVRRESAPATVVWLGLLGYLLYTYIGAAFAYPFNRLFLVCVAAFSLALGALVGALAATDATQIHRQLGSTAPRKMVSLFLFFIALMLGVSELGQIIPALASGTVPELIRRSEGAGNFVYVLDLGVVMPFAVIGGIGLWRRAAWADLLAGILLIKAATMGLALIAMTLFSVRTGEPLELGLTIAYALMAIMGLALSIWFLGARGGREQRSPRRS